ncbi:unnamed protein product [Lota lota]
MGKRPLKVREGNQTSKGKRPNGSTKGLLRNPELSKKRLLSIRRMWMWRRRGRAGSCFFSTPRKGVKHKSRSDRSSSSCNHPGDVKIQHPPDQEKGPTSRVVDGGELQGGCGEVCQPASPSTSNHIDCPQTPGMSGSRKGIQRQRKRKRKRRSGVGCIDKNMVNGFEKTAVDQQPRRDPVCPREACTTLGAQQVTDGKTSSRTSLSPVCKSLPGVGVSSESQLKHGVTHKALISTIKEFLDGFCRVYGSLIPLQKCDILRSLRWPDMDVQKRYGNIYSHSRNIVISFVTKYNSTVVRTMSPSFKVVYKKHTLTLEDLSTLADQNWLNDQVINMYGELIMESTDNKVHFLNSFFHHQLEMKGYEGVRRWTKQVNLFSKRLLLVPVHLEVHWSLVAIDPVHRSIQLYDSEWMALPEVTLGILKYLTSEAKEKRQKLFQTGWVVSANKETPQQNNENDCGVFVLEYCKRLAFRKPLAFSQKEIPNIRKRIYKELCERKLHV